MLSLSTRRNAGIRELSLDGIHGEEGVVFVFKRLTRNLYSLLVAAAARLLT